MDAAKDLRVPRFGLFVWDVIENRLTADEVYARFYDLDPARLVAGVAIEEVIGQIVEEDREHAARSTHSALITGNFGSIILRVRHLGIVSPILCFGRCLRDQEGLPTVFTGGLTEAAPEVRRLFAAETSAH